jgi:hypothetical protein
MSKTEIIAELAHLSAEERAEIRESLDRLEGQTTVSKSDAVPARVARIHSPRLADASKSSDFIKSVVELPTSASL